MDCFAFSMSKYLAHLLTMKFASLFCSLLLHQYSLPLHFPFLCCQVLNITNFTRWHIQAEAYAGTSRVPISPPFAFFFSFFFSRSGICHCQSSNRFSSTARERAAASRRPVCFYYSLHLIATYPFAFRQTSSHTSISIICLRYRSRMSQYFFDTPVHGLIPAHSAPTCPSCRSFIAQDSQSKVVKQTKKRAFTSSGEMPTEESWDRTKSLMIWPDII